MKTFLFLANFYLIFSPVIAGEYRHPEVIKPIVQEKTIQITEEGQVAVGLAASQHHFDFGTYKLQGSVGVGSFGEADALSFAVGKRVDRILFNGSVTRQGDTTGYGAGVNWRF